MALSYSDDITHERLQAVIDGLGDGAKLHIGTVGMATTLVVIPLSNPAFEAPASRMMILAGVPLVANAIADGAPAEAVITDVANVPKITGITVGASSGMLIVSASPFVNGAQIRVESGVIASA